ncbi:MAG: hypothetical protein WC641_01770 [Patescibacteria group bacterium]
MHLRTYLKLSCASCFCLLAFLVQTSPAKASVGTYLTLNSVTSGVDNLIGATNARWRFAATTTDTLVRGDIIQFTFPTPGQAQPFTLNGVTVASSSGISLNSAQGVQLSNKLANPSFENTTTSWTGAYAISGTFTATTTASNGSSAEALAVGGGGGYAALTADPVALLANATNTVTYYARGLSGGEKARILLLDTNGTCNPGNQRYLNFTSHVWECHSVLDGTLYAVGSAYVSEADLTTSFVRQTVVFRTDTTSTLVSVVLLVGGDPALASQTVIYDAAQLESGTVTAYNAGGFGADTPGMNFGGPQGSMAFAYVSSTMTTGTAFNVTLGGITNAAGQLSSFQNMIWSVKAGTAANNPTDAPTAIKYQQTSTDSLARAGGALVSDSNSSITPSSYALNAVATYTFAISATSSIPNGGKIVINLPTEYSLQGVTVNLAQQISNTTSSVHLASFTTSTQFNQNRVILTTTGGDTVAGDIITVVLGGLTNPGTANVYRPFYVYTTKSNDGLLDGSYFGFETADYGSTSGPPPTDTVHIGGTNTIHVAVYKDVNGTLTPLSGDELTQVKVGIGCPDKGFFAGERWLNSNSVATYTNLLDCNYIVGAMPFNKGDQSFYNTFLPPAMKPVVAMNGRTVTSTMTFGIPDGSMKLEITNGVAGQNAFVHAFSADLESFSPVFTSPTFVTEGFSATGTGYVMLKSKSGTNWSLNVEGGLYGSEQNFSSGGVKYWPPAIPQQYIGSAGTTTLGAFPFVQADKALVVSLVKTTGGAISDSCVGVKRSGGGLFTGSQDVICQPNSGSNYVFKVPSGSITIEVMRPGFGKPEEYPVGITAATTTKILYLSAPTNYIQVTVRDGSLRPLGGASLFANGSSGFGQAMTNASGTALIYVPNGTYSVQGFAPALGPLTAQSVTVNSNNPTLTFTINLSNLRTISGTVTIGGTGVAGVKIGARGTGSTNGGNGAETDASGNYVLYVPSGTYEVGGWSDDTGGLPPQNVNVSTANATDINYTLAALGTLRILIQNASDISPLFAGAFSASTGRGNGSNSWTLSGTSKYTDIRLPAGTYNVHANSPLVGEIAPAGTTAAVIANQTVTSTLNVATVADMVSVTGTVSFGGTGVPDVAVWASRSGGPGFYSTVTDSDGNYSLKVPTDRTYKVGVKIQNYIATNGDESLSITTSTSKEFTLLAASSVISGQVLSGSTGLAQAWVSAKKTVGSNEVWVSGATDNAGNFSLNVNSGSTWTLYADAPCYTRSSGLSGIAGESGVNLSLTATAGCSAPTPVVNGVTPASGGSVANSDVSLDFPANVLGTGQSTASISISDAAVVKSSANATPLRGSVQSITATDSDGRNIDLQGNYTITLNYDPNALPTGFDEASLQLGYFDTNSGQWEPVASTVDTVNNKISAQLNHFTDIGPILPGVPDRPTGLAATTQSASAINLSWTAVSGATSYVIYRQTTNTDPFTTSIGTATTASYSDTGRSASTLYYYKVAGVNSNGEGLNSVSANATTNAAASNDLGSGAVGSAGPGGGGSSQTAYNPTFQTHTADPNKTSNLSNLVTQKVNIHALVKLPDDGNLKTQEDSAVYYIGADGKRHAFPNAKIYATWYLDFSGVKVVTPAQLASIPLGANVRYKPGVRMVKFTTDPKTYAVSSGGQLRWIKTEELAKQLYESAWNTKIDDLSDAFYVNYTFGNELSTATDFVPTKQTTGVSQISDDLGL